MCGEKERQRARGAHFRKRVDASNVLIRNGLQIASCLGTARPRVGTDRALFL
jgi:hypothetical protein